MAEYLIVTGLSGAGRSTAAATLEDLGWFVIDNLPSSLIGKVAEIASHPGAERERYCFVVGRGGADAMIDLVPAVRDLRATGARVRVLFLDASDEVLVRRFEGTRRRHPLEGEGVLSAIRSEREVLRPMRDDADVVIDTSQLNVHELHDRIAELFSTDEASSGMETTVVSFGYKHGLPIDVDLVIDCRFLPNPHWIDALRPYTGLDEPVRSYVMEQPEAKELLDKLDDLFAFLIPAYAREGKSYLSIAIGCTGGRHRSVVIAEELGTRIRADGFDATVHHRDIAR
ncbi:MAG TPA: RNase adapter RapZ [Acidimicrobiales bacterium]|nr:RNase adapter RapZ [Acidimicrobiales bacterium]